MQTTLRINDNIYRRSKALAGHMGISLTKLLETSLEEKLSREARAGTPSVQLPVCSVSQTAQKPLSSLVADTDAADLEYDLRKAGI